MGDIFILLLINWTTIIINLVIIEVMMVRIINKELSKL